MNRIILANKIKEPDCVILSIEGINKIDFGLTKIAIGDLKLPFKWGFDVPAICIRYSGNTEDLIGKEAVLS